MKKKRFSAEQIVGVLAEAANGTGVTEVCRRHGISEMIHPQYPSCNRVLCIFGRDI